MAFDLEVTLSGVCVIVLTATSDRPSRPTAVDVLAPAGGGDCGCDVPHRPRLSFWPADALPWIGPLEPRLHVDPRGEKHAEIDLVNRVARLDCGTGNQSYRVDWADDPAEPAPVGSLDEGLFDWIPSVQSLGVMGSRVPQGDDDLPAGALSRWILPPGRLQARDVVRAEQTGDPLVWTFPAVNEHRALANEAVARFASVSFVAVTVLENGAEVGRLFLSGALGSTVRLDFSNDLEVLPRPDVIRQEEDTEHLKLIQSLAIGGQVQVPTTDLSILRSGSGICDPTRFVLIEEEST